MPGLAFDDHEAHIDALIRAALDAADPKKALAAHWPAELSQRSCTVVGAGKASLEMADQLAVLCGDSLLGGAVAVVPERLGLESADGLRSYAVYPAAHPLPDERNIRAAQAIAEAASNLGEGDTLIALISGGGSAHLTLPAGDLKLDDLRQIAKALMEAGAPIQDLNAVRKHCEQLKGGGLARLGYPAAIHSFILSDVLGDPLDVIASGPTAPDPTTYAGALAVLDRFGLRAAVPAVTAHLEAGAEGKLPETLKPGDPVFERVEHTIIGSNLMAVGAVEAAARSMGWQVGKVETGVEGEAGQVGQRLAALGRESQALCYLFGGETTVTVRGNGKGGRNTEMALAAAIALDGVPDVAIFTLATDGIDGPTDSAGAIVTGETCARARELGLDPQAYLEDNDSYSFFDRVGGLIKLGPTGTNVNDVAGVLVY